MRFGIVTIAAIVSACTVGPNYREPKVDVPAQLSTQVVTASVDLKEWWTQFHDAELVSLIARAQSGNLDLKTAASRIRQARAQELIAGASRWPTINATGAGVRLRSNSSPLAAASANSSSQTSASPPLDLTLYSAGFDASWELDAFGGARRNREAAHAQAEAAVWQWRDAQVSLCAEVASAYLALRTTQLQVAIVKTAIEDQQSILHIVEERQRYGFVTELDVNQQRAQLAATQAQLPELEAQASASSHAIALLLGIQPQTLVDELHMDTPMLPSIPTELPATLPSDLLRRRPDIRAAERNLAAATARVGSAMSDLFPKFNLLGALSFTSSSIGHLFDSDNLSRAAIGLIRWPLFNGRRTRGNIRSTEEARVQAYLAYQKSVLVALQDADDAVERYVAEQRRLESLRIAEQSSQASLRIAQEQYRAGVVNYQSVLTASTTYLSTRQQIAVSNLQLAQSLVSIYKALGGGWDENEGVPERVSDSALR